MKPVLIIGGSGIVGSLAVKALRRLQPDLPIAIGGRDLAKADAIAKEVGRAHATRVDLDRADLGQSDADAYSAIAMFVKDETLNSLAYAQARGAAYLSISDGTFEIAPTVARFIHHPTSAPVLMGSHWLVGAATLPILHFARELERIASIEIAVLLDEEDMGGPAAYADYERITTAAPKALIRKDGKFVWIGGDEAATTFKSVDGVEMTAQAYSPLDIVGLAAATDAPSIRLDLALGQSASRRRGEPFSTEIIIQIEGQPKAAAPDTREATPAAADNSVRLRYALVHPAGQAPLSALGVAVCLERLVGLAGGPPVAPGLYLPEVLIDPAYMVARLEEFGTRISRS